MPRIFDNIEQPLFTALLDTIKVAHRADFCVGYFNLRGWKELDGLIEIWPGGPGHCCRLLVGMHRRPEEELRTALGLGRSEEIDQKAVVQWKWKLAQEFREQLTLGAPTNEDEAGLRRLAGQIKGRKVVVKLFLRHPLHAKLYLLFRSDPDSPTVGYLGSSNLTFAGLARQGELNVDVLDHDACAKLARWFDDRWNDRWCMDISNELVQIIEESWREPLVPPYHIYLKMAYHLAQEAIAGLSEFQIPPDFRSKLFEFQSVAVRVAARYLNKRGGVLIGDVVGLGKTLVATALARIFEDDFDLETLIICPRNLTAMWEEHRAHYGLRGRVLSLSMATRELPNLRPYRLVLIDESHNLRNREGRRYRAIYEYVRLCNSKVILLSATPYNKTYQDLGSQLRLFVPDDRDLGIRPEQLLHEMDETEFIRRHQCPVRSLAAFEHSHYADDWRELMRMYLVRRTRTFIKENYAEPKEGPGRKFLTFEDGSKAYFPDRTPQTVKFKIGKPAADPYARLYADEVVDVINRLNLPRYGLGAYLSDAPNKPTTPTEASVILDLSRAGKRLKGFCRTNLFKRLESSGQAFLQSVERHILRNAVFLHAIAHGLDLPIGTQDAELLDPAVADADDASLFADAGDEDAAEVNPPADDAPGSEADCQRRAAEIYQSYAGPLRRRFKWLRPALFIDQLAKDLREDVQALLGVLALGRDWDPAKDAKLAALWKLVSQDHAADKVLIFTQFADTVRYLEEQLRARGLTRVAGVTGDSDDPTALAWRFSPVSNDKRNRITLDQELRVLVATDVLSEGQNLQDCAVVVNFDLPWAIIRLIQRAGRVDRIGQRAEQILCYSFLPAEGVERIIRLRSRVRQRLTENAEVLGTDEAFFEGDPKSCILDLFHEKAGILDDEGDAETDLASQAYEIWKKAVTADPALPKTLEKLLEARVVLATKSHQPTATEPGGVLVYARTAEGNDALAWMDGAGRTVTESQLTILRAAACAPDTPPLPRQENHHGLVKKAMESIAEEEKLVGGQLGRPSGARFRTYERLKRYAEQVKGTLFESQKLLKAIDDIYRNPLRQAAVDSLNRQLRSGVSDEALAALVVAFRDDDSLCVVQDEEQLREPQIICSMGLRRTP